MLDIASRRVPRSNPVPTQRTAHTRLGIDRSVPRAGVAVCAVVGELDLGTVDALRRELDRLLADRRIRSIVVDLSAVGFLGVCAVEVLLRAAGGREECAVVLGGCATRRAFELTGADARLPWYDSRADAVAAASASASACVRYLTAVHGDEVR